MSVRDPHRISDGSLSLEGGCDTGRTPNLLAANQIQFGTNATLRGGWAMPRPGVRKIVLSFSSEEDEANFHRNFQGAGAYTYDAGTGSLISQQGGRQFRIDLSLSNTFKVADISIADDLNPNNRLVTTALQAENYFIIQDGQSKPFIYNGASSQRAVAAQGQIPTCEHMAYVLGRLWGSQGNSYIAGDIVYGSSGSEAQDHRDAILYFTENDFLNEGGAFSVPLSSGPITAMLPIANINTAIGQAGLVIHTPGAIFTNSVPADRTQWKNLTTPIQQIIQINYGGVASGAITNVNGDQYYRAADGWRSLVYAVRNFGEPGNFPISREMSYILDSDDPNLLPQASSVLFNNRLLGTCSPTRSDMGTFHRGLVVINFDLISSMRQKTPPAWEPIWTGWKILKVVTVKHLGVERCFLYVLNEAEDGIELWEITTGDQFDNFTNRIEWTIASRAYNFGNSFDLKKLQSTDIFIDRVSGDVDITLQYKPDGYPCWLPWTTFKTCAKNQTCADDLENCEMPTTKQESYQTKLQATQPPDTFNPVTKEMFRTCFEVQTRLVVKGFCRIKQQRIDAHTTQEIPSGNRLPTP